MSPSPLSPANTSIHKSLHALDAKSITRDIEKSVLHSRGEDPASPTQQQQQQQGANNIPYQSMRQNSVSSEAVPPNTYIGDAWQTLCVRVLPLFNGEGVQGSIEDLNDLLR
jgi:hypothetical protein